MRRKSSRCGGRLRFELTNPLLAGTWAEGRARGKRTRAHAEARAERRRDVAEEIAAAGAMAVAAEGRGEIGAQPVTASIALRIDALHGEAGHVLHLFSLSGRRTQIDSIATAWRWNRANS